MDCRALSPHQLPHTSKLFRDFVENFPKLKSFFEHSPDLPVRRPYAKKLRFPCRTPPRKWPTFSARKMCFSAAAPKPRRISPPREGAVAVVSGQQVGLFGGPAFSFYKALSAIRAAHELSQKGIPAVPVFWMATEDHDVDEVRHVSWFHEGQLCRL